MKVHVNESLHDHMGAGHLIIYRFNLLIDFVLAKLQIPMEFPFRKTSIGTQTIAWVVYWWGEGREVLRFPPHSQSQHVGY
jgi:hypothetical protein